MVQVTYKSGIKKIGVSNIISLYFDNGIPKVY